MSGPTHSLPRPRRRALGARSARPVRRAGRQLTAQCPPPLDVQRLVNRLGRDPHRFIVGILDPEPMGDLLRAPRCRPMSVLAAAMTSTTPGAHVWARHGRPILSHHRAGEVVLHVAPEPIVRGQLGYLRALGTSVAVPLRSRRPIRQTAAPSRRVATQLSRDSRRGSPEPTGNVAHPGALSSQDRDLFPLRHGQGASRSGRQADRRRRFQRVVATRPRRGVGHGFRALGEPRSTSWPSWRQQVHDLDMKSRVHYALSPKIIF